MQCEPQKQREREEKITLPQVVSFHLKSAERAMDYSDEKVFFDL